jgi:hypothetical protein
MFAAAVSAQATTGRDDAVGRDAGAAAVAHDVADGARGARLTGELRHLAVGRHTADRDPPDDSQHASAERVGLLASW